MIRKTVKDDIPAISMLMQSEPGFWQESWREDVLERGIEASEGLSFVWEESGQFLGFICAHDFVLGSLLSSNRWLTRGMR